MTHAVVENHSNRILPERKMKETRKEMKRGHFETEQQTKPDWEPMHGVCIVLEASLPIVCLGMQLNTSIQSLTKPYEYNENRLKIA